MADKANQRWNDGITAAFKQFFVETFCQKLTFLSELVDPEGLNYETQAICLRREKVKQIWLGVCSRTR
jgi:hypothetical protein